MFEVGTSTTLTLALGDALAVVLMERRDFQPEDFKVFHPGGKLGAQMSKVEQLMRPVSEMAILLECTPINEVILSMTQTGYGLAVLIDTDESINSKSAIGTIQSTPQQIGSGITYFRRYHIQSMLNLEADFDDDGNIASNVKQQPTTQTKGGL